MACEEEGLTFDDGIVVRHRKWRASPALAATLPAHPCPAYAMRSSANARWMLSGGNDDTVRLWDTEAFPQKLADPDEKKAAHAAQRTGAIAADVSLGWECVWELKGHTAAIRDVDFNPFFDGPLGAQKRSEPGSEPHDTVEMQKALGGDGATSGAKRAADEGEGLFGIQGPPARLESMVASASADLSIRIWDLSSNPRISRCAVADQSTVSVLVYQFMPRSMPWRSRQERGYCFQVGVVSLRRQAHSY